MSAGSPKAMIEAAQAMERAGEWEAARALYRDAFRSAVVARSLESVVDTLRFHARLQRVQRQYEEAEELAALSWEIARRSGLPAHAARAINMIAAIRYEQADLPEAKRLYILALEQARDVGDDTLIAFACQNLGIIANIEGNLREARSLYLESISASIRAQETASAMMAYSNLGLVCADLEDWMEAEVYFDRGIEIAERLGDSAQMARLYANRAEPLIEVHELERARGSLDRAEEIATRIGYRGVLADVERYRGRIARLQRDFAGADRHVRQALAVTTEKGLGLPRAEVLEELARLRRAEERWAEAAAALAEASRGYAAVGATRDGLRTADLLARWEGEGAGTAAVRVPPAAPATGEAT